jgi:hypothetical protein
MIEGPYKDMIPVWGKLCEVTVYRKSKAVWEAIGDYLGKTYRVTRGTRGAAVNAWAKAAEYHTN